MNNNEAERVLKAIGNVLRHPLVQLPLIRAFLRGCLYIAYYKLFKPNVKIRWPFFVYQKFALFNSIIEITGPGSVFIERFCSIYPNIFHALSIVTLSPSAKVTIGRHCSLGGLTIRCRNCVTIGERTMTAYALIQDCLFMEQGKVRNHNLVLDSMDAKPVVIGRNVWLGAQSNILGGSCFADDSVVSWGTMCYRFSVNEYCFVSGSPAKRAIPISSITRITRNES